MGSRQYLKFLLFMFVMAFLIGFTASISDIYIGGITGIILGYVLFPLLVAWFVHWRGYFAGMGFLKAEERLFKPYFNAPIADRFRIIVAVIVLGFLPLMLNVTLLPEFEYPWINESSFFFLLFFYLVMIAGYGSILFERIRQFYNNYLPPLVIIIFSPIMLISNRLNLENNLDTMGWTVVIVSVLLISIGGIMILKAAQTIAERKARSDTELEFAGEVQKKFLQDIEINNENFTSFATSKSAATVGGDFFYLGEKNGKLIAAVGDVSGHSFAAGLIMVMLKTSFEDHLYYGSEMSALFSRLNDSLYQQSDRSMFATLGVIEVDPESKSMNIWNGGHMPVLKYSAKSKKIESIRTAGIALGIKEGAEFKPAVSEYSSGDIYFLYSDGLVEIRDEKTKSGNQSIFKKSLKHH